MASSTLCMCSRCVPPQRILVASWTVLEPGLGGEYVSRNSLSDSFGRKGLESGVAVHTPSEEGFGGIQIVGFHDLPQLLAKILAFYEETRRNVGARSERTVAGQKDTFLETGQGYELVIIQGSVVNDVDAENAEPTGQFADHGVGYESRPFRINHQSGINRGAGRTG